MHACAHTRVRTHMYTHAHMCVHIPPIFFHPCTTSSASSLKLVHLPQLTHHNITITQRSWFIPGFIPLHISEFEHICSDTYLPLYHHSSHFYFPKDSLHLAHSCFSPSQCLTTTHLLCLYGFQFSRMSQIWNLYSRQLTQMISFT